MAADETPDEFELELTAEEAELIANALPPDSPIAQKLGEATR